MSSLRAFTRSALTLVAKELVVYNNPRSSGNELAEEMVRMLVRVRRHIPKLR